MKLPPVCTDSRSSWPANIDDLAIGFHIAKLKQLPKFPGIRYYRYTEVHVLSCSIWCTGLEKVRGGGGGGGGGG